MQNLIGVRRTLRHAVSVTVTFLSFIVAATAGPSEVLAPTGRLRVGLYSGTPTSILPPDAQFNEPRGVGYDLGKALADRLGVAFEPVVLPKNAEVLEAVKSGDVDVAFTNASAARANDMDFGPSYLAIELGYLVPKGSSVTTLSDIDTAGRRIGVTTGSSSDAALTRGMKAAEIVRAQTFTSAIEMMQSGRIDAFATNKAILFEMAEKLQESVVLEGHWGLERHAIAVPKGRQEGMALIRDFTQNAITSGLVKAAIARAGLRGVISPE